MREGKVGGDGHAATTFDSRAAGGLGGGVTVEDGLIDGGTDGLRLDKIVVEKAEWEWVGSGVVEGGGGHDGGRRLTEIGVLRRGWGREWGLGMVYGWGGLRWCGREDGGNDRGRFEAGDDGSVPPGSGVRTGQCAQDAVV